MKGGYKVNNIWYCVECGDYTFSEPQTETNERRNLWTCPVCQTMSVVKLDRLNDTLQAFAKETEAEFPSMRFDDSRPEYRPLNYLIQALNKAKYFIHVVTESIDGFFLGILAMKYFEHDIEMRVIVWHPQRIYQDLKRLMDHSIIFKGYEHRERPLARGILVATVSEAHQKLIVIDGCIAFKGSANATLDGWTRKGELIEFVTDPLDLRQLNRDYFAEFMARKRSS
jgi:hypothetical protein